MIFFLISAYIILYQIFNIIEYPTQIFKLGIDAASHSKRFEVVLIPEVNCLSTLYYIYQYFSEYVRFWVQLFRVIFYKSHTQVEEICQITISINKIKFDNCGNYIFGLAFIQVSFTYLAHLFVINTPLGTSRKTNLLSHSFK